MPDDYPDVCIHQLFEEQAARTPELTALSLGERRLTYRQLDTHANQLAHHLRAYGVGPETLVAIGAERSFDLIVGLLGILKAGGAYLPIDPGYPSERLAFMLDDAQVPVLLTQQALLSRWPAHSARIICVDQDASAIAARPETPPLIEVAPDTLAYVMYTSGSTGKPKGVAMAHRPICNLAWWQMGASALPRGAHTLQLASASFDVSVQEIFSTLCAGGTLVLITEEARRDPARLLEIIRDTPVARLFLTFTALQQLAEAAAPSQDAPRDLREVITAGEQLRITPAIARWFEALPNCRLCNQYGPTETHVVMTHYTLEGPAKSWPLLPPIGKPLPNTRVYLLDDDLNPVPAGVVGEIVIGGDCLARGYLRRPALTAERFVPDSFCSAGEARMYRSGDFGRLLDDGSIEFMGRRDHQVKVRGFRVELGEVEAALEQHRDVLQAAVAVHENEPGDRRLVAYVASRPGRPPAADALRTFLLGTVPEYMVPAVFVHLEALPVSMTGKIDRQALPPPPKQRSPMAGDRVPPSDPLESRLASMWQELLGYTDVGVTDNFFAVGGDSLTAVRLIDRLERDLGRRITYVALSRDPTIRGLAAMLADPPSDRASHSEPDGPVGEPESIPATAEQEAIWLATSLQPDLPVYNECFALHFNEAIEPAPLECAINELVRRHDILRTAFVLYGGTLVQDRAAEVAVTLAVVDVRDVPPDRAWPRAVAAAEAVVRESFDLGKPPLLRGVLARMPDAGDVLFLGMHHLVIDAYGFYHVLVPEMATAYEACRSGVAVETRATPAMQFADFARWQRNLFGGARAGKLRRFWKAQLADLPPLELPSDWPRPVARSYRGNFRAFSLEERLTSGLKDLAAQEGVSLFTLLVAAFNILLWRYTGEDDIGIMTVDSGRTGPEHDVLLGCCVNTLILRNRLAADLSVRELLMRVSGTIASAFDHRGLPFSEIRQLLGEHVAGPKLPLSVAFVMEPRAPEYPNGWSVSQHDVQTGTAKFDLTLEVEERAAGLIGRIEYATDLFDPERIERMVRHWQVLLEGFVANPEGRLSQLPLLTDGEGHLG